MTQQPPLPASLRGAVDLSSLGAPPPPPVSGGLVVEGTDAGFQQIVADSRDVVAVVVLYSSGLPASAQYVDVLARVAAEYAGRFRVVTVDVDANPGIGQAFQVESVPTVYGLVAGQPVGLFAGAQPAEQVRAVIDQLLAAGVQAGVTGTVAVTGEAAQEPELPPLHQEAFDALDRGDLDGAVAAYEKALRENPADTEAKLGLAQVRLLQRTEGVDPAQARAAAAADPDDIPAALLVADLDVLGGHVEDAFGRLVALVARTSDDDRNAVRAHLVELYDIVGGQDERVVKSRRALMSALF